MSSDYPNSIDTFVNPVGTDSLSSPDHAALHTDVNHAVTNIQLELGTNAKGTDVSVRSRLDRLDSTVMLSTNNLSEITSASSARSHLGLGTIATQNSSNVSITGGTITGTTITGISVAGLASPIAVVDGGTGAITASGARTSLGLGTISTQNANSIVITGGTISGGTVTGIALSNLASPLAIADGGTGAGSASAARTALGLGTISLQAASNVAITGGTIAGVAITGGTIGSLGSALAIADGGTGATTASAARTSLGLGSVATQSASSVALTGGTIAGVAISGGSIGALGSAIAIADGGTGATTASAARTLLGLGSIATQNASSVAITGGTLAAISLTASSSGTEIMRYTTTTTGDFPTEKVFQARDTTTTVTPKNIWTFTISGSKTWFFEARVIARCTGGLPGENGAAYIRRGTIQNIFGSAVLLGPVIDEYSAESVAAWDCTFATDFSLGGTGPNVYLRVTGAATTNITWHAHIRLWEVGA